MEYAIPIAMNFNTMTVAGTLTELYEGTPFESALGIQKRYIFRIMLNPEKPPLQLETLNRDLLTQAAEQGVARGVSVVCVLRLSTFKWKDKTTGEEKYGVNLYPQRLTSMLKWQSEQATPLPLTNQPAPTLTEQIYGTIPPPPPIAAEHIADDNDLPF